MAKAKQDEAIKTLKNDKYGIYEGVLLATTKMEVIEKRKSLMRRQTIEESRLCTGCLRTVCLRTCKRFVLLTNKMAFEKLETNTNEWFNVRF